MIYTLIILLLTITSILSTNPITITNQPYSTPITSLIPTTTLYISNYTISWTASDIPVPKQSQPLTLAVYYNHDQLIWSSNPQQPFISLQMNLQDIEQYDGNFFIRSQGIFEPTSQVVSNIEYSDLNAVQITGYIKYGLPSEVFKVPYTMIFSVASDNIDQLSFKVSADLDEVKRESSNPPNRLVLSYQSVESERVYGFGMQYTHINVKGRTIPILVREQGVGRGEQPLTFVMDEFRNYSGGSDFTTYAPMPFYFTSRNQALFLESYSYSEFNFENPEKVRISIDDSSVSGRIIAASSALDIIESFTKYTGRMRMPPSWMTSGAIIGLEGGQDFVKDMYNQMMAHEVPVAALWLQDWVGARDLPWGKGLWWNWESDDVLYPNWKELVSTMKQNNVQMLTYINPMVVDVEALGKASYRRNLYKEGKKNGYLIKDKNGEVHEIYAQAAIIDIFNVNAKEWVKEIITDLVLEGGVQGYMCDFGESLPLFVGGNNRGTEYHNRYAEEWAKLTREVFDSLSNGKELMFFSRSGFLKSPSYSSLFWLGDQTPTWDGNDGLKSAVKGLLNSGLSGMPFQHSDIGGFYAIDLPEYGIEILREKELFLRWAEFSIFTSAFRTHIGNQPEGNWQFYSDEETFTLFARYAKIFQAWQFYRIQLFKEATLTGHPVARHMMLNYPLDYNVWELDEQYMLGEEWLFAPVLNEGQDVVEVYLPRGVDEKGGEEQWIHLWSQRLYAGGQRVFINAPIGEPCLLIKRSSSTFSTLIQNLINAGIEVSKSDFDR